MAIYGSVSSLLSSRAWESIDLREVLIAAVRAYRESVSESGRISNLSFSLASLSLSVSIGDRELHS